MRIFAKFFFVILVFTGCATTSQPKPLVQQVIRMRAGYTNLTHQICAEKNWLGKCTKWQVDQYDLNDAKVRSELVLLSFRCNIAGWRYKIDPDRPRFVRYSQGQKVNPVDFSETKILVDSATYCYSEQYYKEGLPQ